MADQQQLQPQQEDVNVVHAGGLNLPPGFHFNPSDNEIVSHYLTKKVCNTNFTCTAIGEVDLNKIEPWDLPKEAKWGDKEWYFFYQKDRKYPTGMRANRATTVGYWKSTGKDKEVYNTVDGVVLLIGMKKTLVFYKGRAPRGDKTNWVMHEYRLEGSSKLYGSASTSSVAANVIETMKSSNSSSKDEWVVCRVFHKITGIKKMTTPAYQGGMVGTETNQNYNNILAIPMSLPLHVPMPMQFPILLDFSTGQIAPYYPNVGVGMPPVASVGGVDGHQINNALFGNPVVALPQMNFYHEMVATGAAAGQMGLGAAVAQMDMGAAGAGGFDVVVSESSLSSVVLQKDEQDNATEISSMMSVTGPRSLTTNIEMDGTWKYK